MYDRGTHVTIDQFPEVLSLSVEITRQQINFNSNYHIPTLRECNFDRCEERRANSRRIIPQRRGDKKLRARCVCQISLDIAGCVARKVAGRRRDEAGRTINSIIFRGRGKGHHRREGRARFCFAVIVPVVHIARPANLRVTESLVNIARGERNYGMFP